MAKKRYRWRNVLGGIIIALVLLLGGYMLWLLSLTLANPWIIVGGSAVAAFASGVVLHPLWGKITGTGKFYINFIVNGVVMTLVISAVVLSINYFTVNDNSTHIEKAIVTKVYTKTRHRTRRINRRVYGQGDPYKVYFIEVEFPAQGAKEIEVNFDTFRHFHRGDCIEISLGKGILGMTVVNSQSMTRIPGNPSKRQ